MMNKKLELISGDKMAILNTTLAPNKTVPGSYEIEGTVPREQYQVKSLVGKISHLKMVGNRL